jgi:hypothetical protein
VGRGVNYADWCQAVLSTVLELEGSGASYFGGPQIAAALGVAMESETGPEGHALIAAVEDLEERGLLEMQNYWRVESTLRARPFRTEPLRSVWRELREGHLEPDDEAFLGALVELSAVEHDGWCEARWAESSEVFERLGWDWDVGRSVAILKVLDEYVFAKSRMMMGGAHHVRARLSGAVRAMDEIGAELAEARAHVSAGRVRAAGCIAGVVLERRLVALAAAHSVVMTKKINTLDDYNMALKGRRVYDQATWRRIQHLTDLRNRCAHALPEEPTTQDARDIVEGVEAVLRTLEAAGPAQSQPSGSGS